MGGQEEWEGRRSGRAGGEEGRMSGRAGRVEVQAEWLGRRSRRAVGVGVGGQMEKEHNLHVLCLTKD